MKTMNLIPVFILCPYSARPEVSAANGPHILLCPYSAASAVASKAGLPQLFATQEQLHQPLPAKLALRLATASLQLGTALLRMGTAPLSYCGKISALLPIIKRLDSSS